MRDLGSLDGERITLPPDTAIAHAGWRMPDGGRRIGGKRMHLVVKITRLVPACWPAGNHRFSLFADPEVAITTPIRHLAGKRRESSQSEIAPEVEVLRCGYRPPIAHAYAV